MSRLKKIEEQNKQQQKNKKENQAAVAKSWSSAMQVDPPFLEIGMLIVSEWK